MLLALHPNKFLDSLCKKPPGSMDEQCEQAKGSRWKKCPEQAKRSAYQGRFPQVEQEAQARQAPTSLQRAQVQALHTTNTQSHHDSRGSFQPGGTHPTNKDETSQARVRCNQIQQISPWY